MNREELESRERDMLHSQARMRPVFDARPLAGERVEFPREGLPPVRANLYRTKAERAPVVVNLHGGGFVGGDAVLMDSFCRLLSESLGALVVNLNYRKAPEYRFPFAIEELLFALEFLRGRAEDYGIDPEHIAVCGHSAGASIAAGAALRAKARGIPLAMQALVYPYIAEGKPLSELYDFDWMYLKEEDVRDPAASPLLATDEQLSGIAPAAFVFCGQDELREAGEAYAQRLIGAGVPVLAKRYGEALHGFVEVNRDDYFFPDERKSPEQAALSRDAERFLIHMLTWAFEGGKPI